MQFYAHHYNVSKWKTVYVGGGTPSQLTVTQLSALLDGIFTQAPAAPDAEVTVEVNPDDVSLELIQCLSLHGVNRISMGIQSFDQKALDAVHRQASAQSAMHALDLLQKHWNGRLSCDLIAGLPNHSRESFEKGVEYLCSCGKVDHISLYTLTVEDGTPLAAKIDSGEVKWSQEKADRMWIRGRDILEASSFLQYEVSNFSRPNCQSRHNTVYWKLENYIGCGAGASGTMYAQGERWTNTCSLVDYASFWKDADPLTVQIESLPRSVEKLDKKTQEFEFLMMGFRLLEGVDAEAYRIRFGGDLGERLGAERGIFADWKKRGLASTDGRHYALTRKGILLLNRFLEELL